MSNTYERAEDGKWAHRVVIVENNKEYFGKSTDTKPTQNLTTGSTFFEIDTKIVSMWDGTQWVVI